MVRDARSRRMRSLLRRGAVWKLALVLALGGAAPLSAATNANGFFDEYLVLGPYQAAGGNPAQAQREQDYLCDGEVSEDDILPEAGMELLLPVASAGDCSGSTPPSLRPVHANVRRGPGGGPLIEQARVNDNDAMNWSTYYAGATNVVAYAWVYVNNLTGATQKLQMGIASDDSIELKVNRERVFSLGIGRGYGGAGTVQNRFPVRLLPGGNLIQIKVFQGSGGWGFRARLERPDPTCTIGATFPVLHEPGVFEIGTEAVPLVDSSTFPTATRTITTTRSGPNDENVRLDVSIAVDARGNPFTLTETFDPGWTASNVTPAATVTPGRIRWSGTGAAVLGYRLTRSDDFLWAAGAIDGELEVAPLTLVVGGAAHAGAGLDSFPREVLITPPFIMDPFGVVQGCNITAEQIQGGWIAGGGVTDANIVPADGLEIDVEYGGDSQAGGLHLALGAAEQGRFWSDPNPSFARARLARVTSSSNDYDFQAAGIFNADPNGAMATLYFYLVNPSASVRHINLFFGSDDSGLIRVNGHAVHVAPECRGFGLLDKVRVALDPGKNLVALYAFENAGGFGVSLRFEDDDFNPLPLRVTLNPAGYDPAARPVRAGAGTLDVRDVLLTPPLAFSGDPCLFSAAQREGGWIHDGAAITDSGIQPFEGMELRPQFGGASQASGLHAGLPAARQAVFWSIPGSPASSNAILARVRRPPANHFNFQHANIYNFDPNNVMNAAYFYVVNPHATSRCYRFTFGSDDVAVVRVNGQLAHVFPGCRGFSFADRFTARMDPGKNLVSIYTFDNTGGWGMGVIVQDEDGAPAQTSLDPAGYSPAGHSDPRSCPAPAPAGIYTSLGFVSQFLVPAQVMETVLVTKSSTIPNAVPEDYITTADGNPPEAATIFEGAAVSPGSSGLITNAVRGAGVCGTTVLVRFDGAGGPFATAGDPGLFDGQRFYSGQFNWSTTLFFFLDNKTAGPKNVYIGFASDDAASLFLNGDLLLEHLVGRGFGGASTIQNGPLEATLARGLNLVQLSFTQGTGGSGARVSVHNDCARTRLLDPDEVEVTLGPRPSLLASRTLGRLDCRLEARVVLSFSVLGGGTAGLELREVLPAGAAGSNPSRGAFDAAGRILSFSGMVSDGDEITYTIRDLLPGETFCDSSANGLPIAGDFSARRSTDFCGDIEEGIYVNCGGGEFIDGEGRVWSGDTLVEPSAFLTGPNVNVADFGSPGTVDLVFDPFIGERLFPAEIFPTERWNNGPIEYTVSGLPAGDYEVVLLFMEGCCSSGCDPNQEDPRVGAGAGGCRVFDVKVNGVFPANPEAPFPAGRDGDKFSQRIAGNNQDRVATHLKATVPAVDGAIVIQLIDLGSGNPPENASIKAFCINRVESAPPVGPRFVRGDVDANGAINLADAIRTLNYLFLGSSEPECLDAADFDDSGGANPTISDAIGLLNWLFLGGRDPARPTPSTAVYAAGDCGVDPTDDDLMGCRRPPQKCQ
jgi:hypothetical protein